MGLPCVSTIMRAKGYFARVKPQVLPLLNDDAGGVVWLMWVCIFLIFIKSDGENIAIKKIDRGNEPLPKLYTVNYCVFLRTSYFERSSDTGFFLVPVRRMANSLDAYSA